jgi:hypothetical protein
VTIPEPEYRPRRLGERFRRSDEVGAFVVVLRVANTASSKVMACTTSCSGACPG